MLCIRRTYLVGRHMTSALENQTLRVILPMKRNAIHIVLRQLEDSVVIVRRKDLVLSRWRREWSGYCRFLMTWASSGETPGTVGV